MKVVDKIQERVASRRDRNRSRAKQNGFKRNSDSTSESDEAVGTSRKESLPKLTKSTVKLIKSTDLKQFSDLGVDLPPSRRSKKDAKKSREKTPKASPAPSPAPSTAPPPVPSPAPYHAPSPTSSNRKNLKLMKAVIESKTIGGQDRSKVEYWDQGVGYLKSSTLEGLTPNGLHSTGATPIGPTPTCSTPIGYTTIGSAPNDLTQNGSTPNRSILNGSSPNYSALKSSIPNGSTSKVAAPNNSWVQPEESPQTKASTSVNTTLTVSSFGKTNKIEFMENVPDFISNAKTIQQIMEENARIIEHPLARKIDESEEEILVTRPEERGHVRTGNPNSSTQCKENYIKGGEKDATAGSSDASVNEYVLRSMHYNDSNEFLNSSSARNKFLEENHHGEAEHIERLKTELDGFWSAIPELKTDDSYTSVVTKFNLAKNQIVQIMEQIKNKTLIFNNNEEEGVCGQDHEDHKQTDMVRRNGHLEGGHEDQENIKSTKEKRFQSIHDEYFDSIGSTKKMKRNSDFDKNQKEGYVIYNSQTRGVTEVYRTNAIPENKTYEEKSYDLKSYVQNTFGQRIYEIDEQTTFDQSTYNQNTYDQNTYDQNTYHQNTYNQNDKPMEEALNTEKEKTPQKLKSKLKTKLFLSKHKKSKNKDFEELYKSKSYDSCMDLVDKLITVKKELYPVLSEIQKETSKLDIQSKRNANGALCTVSKVNFLRATGASREFKTLSKGAFDLQLPLDDVQFSLPLTEIVVNNLCYAECQLMKDLPEKDRVYVDANTLKQLLNFHEVLGQLIVQLQKAEMGLWATSPRAGKGRSPGKKSVIATASPVSLSENIAESGPSFDGTTSRQYFISREEIMERVSNRPLSAESASPTGPSNKCLSGCRADCGEVCTKAKHHRDHKHKDKKHRKSHLTIEEECNTKCSDRTSKDNFSKSGITKVSLKKDFSSKKNLGTVVSKEVIVTKQSSKSKVTKIKK